MIFYLTALIIAAADQAIKFFVVNSLAVGESAPLIGNFLKVTHLRNTGAAFSLFTGYSTWLAIFGLLISLFVFYLHFRLPRQRVIWQFALGALLGGSIGNLIDRFLRGYVIDYLALPFWPVFNLADIMINCGVIILAWVILTAKEGG